MSITPIGNANAIPLEALRAFVLTRRKKHGFKQREVAERSGVSQSWVASLEAGRLKTLPLRDTLIKLAKGLHSSGEQPGGLFNFLELVLNGTFASETVQAVASGTRDLAVVLNDAVSGVGLAAEPEGGAPTEYESIFYNREMRAEGLAQVLRVLKRDFAADDFVVARRLIELLYENSSNEPPEPPPMWAKRSQPEPEAR